MTEIKPRQLRALLLLLFLVPLIPAALTVRFMFDTLKVERMAALDRIRDTQTDALANLLGELPPTEGSDAERAEALLKRWRLTSERDVVGRVVDRTGRVLAAEGAPWDRPVASVIIPGMNNAAMQVYLSGPEVLDGSIAEARQFLYATVVLTILAVVIIAGTAAFALHQQFQLKDIRNTSVATVAHELRTPLASMRMLVDTLREGRVGSEQQRQEYLELIAAENDRLTRLAETFLTFSRLERGGQSLRLESVAPRAVAEKAAGALGPRLAEAKFKMEVPQDLPPMRADSEAAAQVIINLLDNALKYTGPEKCIALRASADGRWVKFLVEDNGIGISGEMRRAIFRPFFQADQRLSRSREGCGLGLAIARRIMDAHRGEIQVAGEPGKGSVFEVKFPLA